jgi:hypothetical protein
VTGVHRPLLRFPRGFQLADVIGFNQPESILSFGRYQRDVRDLAHIGSLDAVPKLLTLAASQPARLAILSEMASQFELSRPTIRSYLTLIERHIGYLPAESTVRVPLLRTLALIVSVVSMSHLASADNFGHSYYDRAKDQLVVTMLYGVPIRIISSHSNGEPGGRWCRQAQQRPFSCTRLKLEVVPLLGGFRQTPSSTYSSGCCCGCGTGSGESGGSPMGDGSGP